MSQEIKDILILQKRELENKLKEKYINRRDKLEGLDSDIIKVIIGPRRAGKSFFSIHLLNKIGDFGYVNFDEIITAMNSIYKNPKYVFFDEIQNLPNWELFVNRLQRGSTNLIITGSNSKLLSKELATHLTGRHFLTHILPFSFKEFIDLDKKELTTIEIKNKFEDYIFHGGYPEPLIKNLDFKEYLSTLFNSVIYKDIINRYKIRANKEMENLSFYLLSNIANEYSYNSLTKVTDIKSSHTIQKYMGYLEESFIFFSLNRFSYKVKEQISSNKKIYCIDNGFIQAKAFKLSPNIGKLYENIVAIELKRREYEKEIEVYYWKNVQNEEVDFLIKKGTLVKQLIQVCSDIKNSETKNREIRALIKAGEDLKCKDLLMITDDYEGEEKTEWFDKKAIIKFIPAWKWLLEKNSKKKKSVLVLSITFLLFLIPKNIYILKVYKYTLEVYTLMITKNESKVLRMLLMAFGEEYSINRIAKVCGLSPNGALKTLRKFESQGILTVKKIANINSYKINFSNNKTKNILELALIPEIPEKIKYRYDDLGPLKKITEIGIIFGSYITDKQKPTDIDLFFVLDKKNFNEYKTLDKKRFKRKYFKER